MTGHLLPEELDWIEVFTVAIDAFARLPEAHPADLAEAIPHFHALQNIVMARAAVRAHPDRFTPLERA